MTTYRSAWRYYARCYRAHRLPMAAAIVASLGQSMLVLPMVYLVQYAFDTIIPSHDKTKLILAGVAILGLTLLSGGIALWVRYTALKFTKIVIRDIRADLLLRLLGLSRSYYTATDRSLLHASIVQDTERVDVMSNSLINDVCPALLGSAALSCVMIYLNWRLFLVMISVAPLALLVNRTIGRRLKARGNVFRSAFDKFSKGVLAVVQTIDLTRVQTAEQMEMERQMHNVNHLRVSSGSMAWLDTAYAVTQNSLSSAASVLILIAGGLSILNGQMSVGQLLSFFVTARLLTGYVQGALASIRISILGNEALLTLHSLIQEGDPEPYTGANTPDFKGRIAFEGVHFHYKEAPVLQGADLEFPPGRTVAIVGPNGSGKTTIIYLLAGLYRPAKGRVLADNNPYDELDMRKLRARFGIVLQDPLFFTGSIRENITYGLPGATLNQVVDAARLAGAENFIADLPQGYDSPMGDNGVLLSGGQKQRIAIARALVRRPRLLILDEPTNHLDAEGVHTLMQTLRQLPQAPTIVLISHDEEVVKHSDIVYRLENGVAHLALAMKGLPARP